MSLAIRLGMGRGGVVASTGMEMSLAQVAAAMGLAETASLAEVHERAEALTASNATLTAQVARLAPVERPLLRNPEIAIRPIERIFVTNRGEAASRLIRAAKKRALESGRKIEVVVPYFDVDKGAPFVTDADIAVYIPPSRQKDVPDLGEDEVQKIDDQGQPKFKKLLPYLDLDLMLELITEYDCDAVWPGWGFLSENDKLSDSVAGLTTKSGQPVRFIGPGGDAIRIVGDKIGFKRLSDPENKGWSGGALNTLADAQTHASRLGYPVVIKATSGGGGKGIQFVTKPEELESAYETARKEAKLAFNDDTVFMEKAILPGPGRRVRHIEVQVVADQHGNVIVAGDRDCSIQGANQKIIEEAPAPGISPEVRQGIHARAIEILKKSGYVGAATVEGLYVDEEEVFYPMELNARLQVEHTITEEVSGIDLVLEQFRVAEGDTLSFHRTPEPRGVAIEVRINAENADGEFDKKKGFNATGGTLHVYRPPMGVRVDSGVREGTVVPVGFDKMLAKVIGKGRDRNAAIAATREALQEFAIDGVVTNRSFADEILAHPDFVEGRYTTRWVPDAYLPTRKPWQVKAHSQEALVAAAILAHRRERLAYESGILATLKRGSLASLPPRKENTYHFELFDREYSVRVREISLGRYEVYAAGRYIPVSIEEQGTSEYDFQIDGKKTKVVGSEAKGKYELSVNGVAFSVGRPAVGEVRADAPGTIPLILVKVGQVVEKGEPVVVREAMKLQETLKAPLGGRIEEILVQKGAAVSEGKLLVRIDTSIGERKAPEAPMLEVRVDGESAVLPLATLDDASFRAAVGTLKDNVGKNFPEMVRLVRQAFLGYDSLDLFYHEVTRKFEKVRELSPFCSRFFEVLGAVAKEKVSQDALIVAASGMLNAFIDIEMLFQRDGVRRTVDAPTYADRFDSFLKTRQTTDKDFEAHLLLALGHFGVTALTPSRELDHALARIRMAHEDLAVRQKLLMRLIVWLREVRTKGEYAADTRLAESLEKFNALDRELVDLTHAAMGAEFEFGEAHLGLVVHGESRRRLAELMRRVESYEPGGDLWKTSVGIMARMPEATSQGIAETMASPNVKASDAAAEAFFTRNYSGRHGILSHRVMREPDGRPVSIGRLKDGRTQSERTVVTVTAGNTAVLQENVRGLVASAVAHLERELAGGMTYDNNLEIILPGGVSGMGDFSAIATALSGVIGYVPTSLNVKRITFSLSNGTSLEYLTFRDEDQNGRFEEDPLFRYIHPYRAHLMELWRFKRYWDVTKITTRWHNNHLFLLQEKPGEGDRDPDKLDRRLFAYSVVTHLSEPRRDDKGRLYFSEVDLAFGQAVHSIREAQAAAGKESGAHRIHLIVRPQLTASRQDLMAGIARLAPRIRGMRVEETNLKILNWKETPGDEPKTVIIRVRNPRGSGLDIKFLDPVQGRAGDIRPRTPYDVKVERASNRGLVEPYAYIRSLTADRGFGEGSFQELDIRDDKMVQAPDGSSQVHYVIDKVERKPGNNRGKVVFGVLERKTKNHPDGIRVVQIANDSDIALCPLEGPECARIVAAIDYAEQHGLEVDWKATSSGAGISMTKGTDNLDWTAIVMRRLGEFTSAGGVVNVIVDGVNIGAQSYWNAQSTMKVHRKGLLIMTPQSYMALTGNEAQKSAGSVAAESNQALAGAQRIMGPNGECQFLVENVKDGADLLWEHHDLTWRKPGAVQPELRPSQDPEDRDVTQYVYQGSDGKAWNVGAILNDVEKKTPFPVAAVMEAVADSDGPDLPQRWSAWQRGGAELIKVQETTVGGVPTTMIGVEARPLPREGEIPPGYPAVWSGSTLFPEGSKKMAHAINAASGRTDAVIMANLSGFDGSPESLLTNQLEWGTEIAEAVRNFKGRLVFVVTTRYHGGAYVVFSRVMNPHMMVGALSGTFASVIGGAVAVKVVFPKKITDDAEKRLREPALLLELQGATTPEAREKIRQRVRDEVEGEYLRKYDGFHTVARARDVGSISEIVRPSDLRPWIIRQLREGRARYREAAESRIEFWGQAFETFFASRGPEAIAAWDEAMKSLGLGPYLARMRGGAMPPEGHGGPAKVADGMTAGGATRTAGDSGEYLTCDLELTEALAGRWGTRVAMKRVDLPEGLLTGHVVSYASVVSTNDVARELGRRHIRPGSVIVADQQTGGRGRGDHQWLSKQGAGLYLTADVSLDLGLEEAHQLTFSAAVAVARAVAELSHTPPRIKWPNDIYLGDKKIAGILIEKIAEGRFAIGIGLNTNALRNDFGGDLSDRATSLRLDTGSYWNHDLVLGRVLARLSETLSQLKSGQWADIRREYDDHSYLHGRSVKVTRPDLTGAVSGVVRGVASNGGLILLPEGAEQPVVVADGTVEVI